MIEIKPRARQFISLNSRSKRRHSSLPFFFPVKTPFKLSVLSCNEVNRLLDYLALVDLYRFHEALKSNPKTKEGAKTIINYLAKSQRIYSVI